jgi:Mg2+/Co2+ transporter CorB
MLAESFSITIPCVIHVSSRRAGPRYDKSQSEVTKTGDTRSSEMFKITRGVKASTAHSALSGIIIFNAIPEVVAAHHSSRFGFDASFLFLVSRTVMPTLVVSLERKNRYVFHLIRIWERRRAAHI